MDEVNIIIRSLRDEDLPLIYSTWRNSVFYDDKKKQTYSQAKTVFKDLTEEIKDTLHHSDVNVACFVDDPDTIIGYSIFTGRHLIWIYVKHDYRQSGIGTLLLPKNIESCDPPRTKIGRAIFQKKNLKEKSNGDTKEARTGPGLR